MTLTNAARSLTTGAFFAVLLATGTGCAGSLSAPFDKMKDQPMTVYRLQNYEPQPATPATPSAPAGGLQLPPQLQQWASQAAQLLPPGLLPPGLLPGTTPAATQQNAPRFDGFIILGTSAVNDSSLRNDILDTFGHESNWSNKYENCFFPEFGFAMAQTGGPPVDVLVSLSCQQVKMGNQNATWPYGPKIGIPPDTQKKIAAIVQKAFGG